MRHEMRNKVRNKMRSETNSADSFGGKKILTQLATVLLAFFGAGSAVVPAWSGEVNLNAVNLSSDRYSLVSSMDCTEKLSGENRKELLIKSFNDLKVLVRSPVISPSAQEAKSPLANLAKGGQSRPLGQKSDLTAAGALNEFRQTEFYKNSRFISDVDSFIRRWEKNVDLNKYLSSTPFRVNPEITSNNLKLIVDMKIPVSFANGDLSGKVNLDILKNDFTMDLVIPGVLPYGLLSGNVKLNILRTDFTVDSLIFKKALKKNWTLSSAGRYSQQNERGEYQFMLKLERILGGA